MSLTNKDLDSLYRKHRNMVRGIIFEYVKDPSLVSDLMNDVFVRALEAKDTYKGNSKPSTWLHTIAERTCLNYLRDQDRKPDLVNESDIAWDAPEDMEDESWLEQHSVDSDEPEGIISVTEFVGEKIALLTEAEKQVAEYYHDMLMSPAEIAEEMEIATATVYVHLKNVKDKLSS